jgi:hypothetical protein
MAYPYLRQAQDCLAKQLLARVVGQQQLLHFVGHHLQGQLYQPTANHDWKAKRKYIF